jgi:ABC-type polysaccharide/polyol phosphate transport system ATPase subunit
LLYEKPANSDFALKDVTISVAAGAKIAIVGENGAK